MLLGLAKHAVYESLCVVEDVSWRWRVGIQDDLVVITPVFRL